MRTTVKAQLQASQDIATAIVTYTRPAAVSISRRRRTGDERAAPLARLRFDEGATDFLQVLDAEERCSKRRTGWPPDGPQQRGLGAVSRAGGNIPRLGSGSVLTWRP